MANITRLAMAGILALCTASGAFAGALTAPAGYACVDTPLNMPAGAWFGGFDILPNGNFVVSDGFSIREITPAGADVGAPLYSYSSYVYGSFVKYNDANGRVYFGESSSNTIMSVPAGGGDASLVATLSGNYDIAFWNGSPYVVAGSSIYRVDEATGAADTIASAGSVSGPLIFDSAGSLIYGTGNPNWPPTLNDQNIYLWSAGQVAGAIGTGSLTAADASLLAQNVDAPSGFAFNGLGELTFTDSQVAPGVIQILRGGAAEVFSTTQSPTGPPWLTALRYNPTTGGISAAVSWFDPDWTSHTVISTLTPVPVPEPSSLAALCSFIGLAGPTLLLRSRRR